MRYLALLLLPTCLAAEADLSRGADCVLAAGSPGPLVCAAEAMAGCGAGAAEAPAVATLCFRTAQQQFGDAISGLMTQLTEGLAEELAAVAGIEVKYDLLGGLMQCDRMTELAMVGETPSDQIQLNAEACTATATGATYLRLVMRARDL